MECLSLPSAEKKRENVIKLPYGELAKRVAMIKCSRRHLLNICFYNFTEKLVL